MREMHYSLTHTPARRVQCRAPARRELSYRMPRAKTIALYLADAERTILEGTKLMPYLVPI